MRLISKLTQFIHSPPSSLMVWSFQRGPRTVAPFDTDGGWGTSGYETFCRLRMSSAAWGCEFGEGDPKLVVDDFEESIIGHLVPIGDILNRLHLLQRMLWEPPVRLRCRFRFAHDTRSLPLSWVQERQPRGYHRSHHPVLQWRKARHW